MLPIRKLKGGCYNRMVTHHEQTVFREYEQQGTGLKPKQGESGYRQVDEAGGWARASRGGRSSLGNYSDY